MLLDPYHISFSLRSIDNWHCLVASDIIISMYYPILKIQLAYKVTFGNTFNLLARHSMCPGPICPWKHSTPIHGL